MTTLKANTTASKESVWKGKTRGGNFGQNFLVKLIARLSVRSSYILLDVALPFYLPFNRKGFNATKKYFVERLGCDPKTARKRAYATHRQFGRMMFDRFRFYSKGIQDFKVSIDGNEEFLGRLESGEGFVIAGSHVGSMEMAGYMLGLKSVRINAVIFGGETAAMQQFRTSVLDEHGVRMIPVKDDMSHLFIIKSALDNGELVSMPCDRLFGSKKYFETDFLGAPARFPIGAFMLAAQTGKDVLTLFNLKEEDGNYTVYVRPLEVSREGRSSREIAKDLALAYVRQLEAIVRKYPEQWFNFYDFWKLDA